MRQTNAAVIADVPAPTFIETRNRSLDIFQREVRR